MALAVLLALNTIAVDNETKAAKVTVTGARIVSLSDGDLQVKEDGPPTAPPIVLLHGYTGSMRWWDAITPLLAKDHHVIRIDLLGHGGSEKPANGYSMKNQAQLVAEALNQLGVAGATVVGHSMGGIVATALGETSPQLVARIAVIDTPPDNSFAHNPIKQRLSRTPVLGELTWRALPDSQFADGLKIAFAKGFPVPAGFVSDLRGMTYTSYKDSHDALDAYVGQQSLDARLQPLAIPLLVIFGAQDQLLNPKAANAYSDVPGVEIHTIAGAGHSPQIEKPQETANLILTFARAGEQQLANELAKARAQKAQKAAQQAAARRKARSAARHKKPKSRHH